MSFIEYSEGTMRFETPNGQVAFEIPDDWWSFAEMDSFSTKGGRFYAYPPDTQGVDVVPRKTGWRSR
jgi:hypothetical protein